MIFFPEVSIFLDSWSSSKDLLLNPLRSGFKNNGERRKNTMKTWLDKISAKSGAVVCDVRLARDFRRCRPATKGCALIDDLDEKFQVSNKSGRDRKVINGRHNRLNDQKARLLRCSEKDHLDETFCDSDMGTLRPNTK